MSTTEAAGRSITDANDVDNIIIERSDVDEIVHTIHHEQDVLFTWDYERSRPGLVKLYEKAKKSQWNASTDLDWSTDVDNDRLAALVAHLVRADALILLLGAGIFAAIYWRAGGHFTPDLINITVAGFISVFFVSVYFGLFIAVTAATPGLLWMGL